MSRSDYMPKLNCISLSEAEVETEGRHPVLEALSLRRCNSAHGQLRHRTKRRFLQRELVKVDTIVGGSQEKQQSGGERFRLLGITNQRKTKHGCVVDVGVGRLRAQDFSPRLTLAAAVDNQGALISRDKEKAVGVAHCSAVNALNQLRNRNGLLDTPLPLLLNKDRQQNSVPCPIDDFSIATAGNQLGLSPDQGGEVAVLQGGNPAQAVHVPLVLHQLLHDVVRLRHQSAHFAITSESTIITSFPDA